MSNSVWKAYGPFELKKSGSVTWVNRFRSAVAGTGELADAAGVYIIAITNRQSHRIQYIGMTHRQGFAAEVFSQANLKKVWLPLESKKGRCVSVWLIAKPKAKHTGFAWTAAMEKQAFLLETLFIMHAKAAGHQLINTKKMKSASSIAVGGLFGAKARGQPSIAVKSLADLLW